MTGARDRTLAGGAGDLDAGGFAAWLDNIGAALRGERDTDVPCDGCTACCRSSQFVHIGPDERDALAHIPKALLFPAPRMPAGHLVLGYDERGHCPMLREDGCSIYEHRPRTCRTYDCRIFPATGVDLDDADKAEIRARAVRWRFRHPTENDVHQHEAVRAVAVELRRRAADEGDVLSSTQLAVLAIQRSAEAPQDR